jgi:hypothetical protein
MNYQLYTGTSIPTKFVIPAKAGIQEKTGFRIKPGMTNAIYYPEQQYDYFLRISAFQPPHPNPLPLKGERAGVRGSGQSRMTTIYCSEQ